MERLANDRFVSSNIKIAPGAGQSTFWIRSAWCTLGRMSSISSKPKRKRAEDRDLRYRELLKRPELSKKEIEEVRQTLRAIARAICEHTWNQEFY